MFGNNDFEPLMSVFERTVKERERERLSGYFSETKKWKFFLEKMIKGSSDGRGSRMLGQDIASWLLPTLTTVPVRGLKALSECTFNLPVYVIGFSCLSF